MNPKISIVIPVYNVEKYVSKCLQSVVNQTYRNLEIIIVNDGSTDNSVEIVKKYKKIDQRIKLINKENGGLSSARNAGISLVTGQYVTFIDSDDWISSNYIDEMVLETFKYSSDIVSIRETLVEGNRYQKHLLGTDTGQKVFEGNCADALFSFWDTNFAWGKLIRTNLIKDKIEFPVGRNYEDIGTMYKIYDRANTLVISDKASYFYRIRENSITNNIKRSDIEDQIFFLNQIRNYKFKKKYKYLNCYLLCKGFVALSLLYKSDIKVEQKHLKEYIYASVSDLRIGLTWMSVRENSFRIFLMKMKLADKCLLIKNHILKKA